MLLFICFIDGEKIFIDGLSMFVIRWSCSFLKGNIVNYRSARTTSSVVDEVGFIEISADGSRLFITTASFYLNH